MAEQMTKMYGWFDAPGQTEPTYEPPRDGPCVICGAPVHAGDARTINMMWTPDQTSSAILFLLSASNLP